MKTAIRKHFTAIELLIVVAIISLLAAMLLPAISVARYKALWTSWREEHGYTAGQVPFSEFQKAFVRRDENGKAVINESVLFSGLETSCKSNVRTQIENGRTQIGNASTNYDLWCKYTGNPKKYTAQEFKVLLEQGLIKECSFEAYKRVSGNPRNLSEDEFDALVKAGIFDFSGVWSAQ